MIQEFGLLIKDLKNDTALEFSSMHTGMCLIFFGFLLAAGQLLPRVFASKQFKYCIFTYLFFSYID
jgi:hypothetical protein